MKNLKYIANLRLPTERAHSIQIMKMCEAFAVQGVDVELIIPDKQNNLGYGNVFEYYGVKEIFKITKIPSTDFLGKTQAFGRIFYALDLLTFVLALSFKKFKEETVIYLRDPLLALSFLGRRLPSWVEIHDVPKGNFLFHWFLKKAHGVVAITHSLKRVLVEKGLSDRKIIVAPDAIDLSDFKVKPSQIEARTKLGLSLEKKIIMYIGLLDEWKGYQTLIKASEFLPSDYQVVIMGGTEEQIKSLRGKYEKVVFLGFKPYKELAVHQQAADVLVIPNSGKTDISKYFTSPLKLFAHMTSGVPVVASDLPSLREILNDSNAYFFSPDNVESLVETLGKVLSSYPEAQEKANQALKEVAKYTWENRAKKIIEFIK